MIAAITAGVISASAGVWSAAQGMVAPTLDSKMFSVETAGVNPRAYVFSVKKGKYSAVNMQCIVVYTESDLGEKKGGKSVAPVMQCVKY